MGIGNRHVIFTAAIGLAACQSQDPSAPPSTDSHEIYHRFVGTVSGGRLSIEPYVGQEIEGLHQVVPVDKDGRPGTGRAGRIELVTTSVGFDEAGCGAPDTHCGDVEMRSFLSGPIESIWVRLLVMWPASGFESSNSDPDTSGEAFDRLGYGLWSYGSLAPGEATSKRWVFRQPADGDFRFYGEVRARVPAGPTVAGTLNVPPPASVRRAIQDADDDGLAYFASGPGGVQVADISDPSSPSILGGYTEPGMDCSDLVQVGSIVYAASGTAGVKCVGVSNPNAPNLIGTIPTSGGGSATTVAALGDALYVGVGGDVQIFDISNPLSPVFVGLLGANNASEIVRVVVDGVNIYCLYRNGQVFVASGATNPLAPTQVAAIAAFAPNATDLIVRNGIAFCGYRGGVGTGGLLIADWRDPLNPATIWWDGGSDTTGLGLYGRTLACIYGDGRFATAGLSDLSSPVIISTAFTPGAPTGVTVFRNGFALCAYGTQLQFIDPPPFVVKQMPESEGGCPNDDVTLSFSANIDPASVTASSVQLLQNGAPVAATRSVSGNVVTLNPDAPLGGGTYEVVTTNAVRNVRGTAAAPHEGSFDATSACIQWISAPTTAVEGGAIAFQFSVAGLSPTSARVRISRDPNPADPFVPSTLLLGAGGPPNYTANGTAPDVESDTTYYAVPEVLVGATRYYGRVTSYVVQNRVTPTGLFAEWRFEGNANDTAGFGFHATTNSGTFVAGQHGQAISFVGTQRAVVPGSPNFVWGESNSDYTISYWLRVAAPSGNWRSILHKTTGGDCCATGQRNPAHFMYPSTLQLAAAHGTTANGNDYGTVNVGPANTWFHFAEVHDGLANVKRQYVNGVLQNTRAVSPTTGSAGNLIVGYDGFYGAVNMQLDNLRVWRRVLSAAEIATDMVSP